MFVHTVIMVIEPHMKQGRQHKLISNIFLATSVTKKLDHNISSALLFLLPYYFCLTSFFYLCSHSFHFVNVFPLSINLVLFPSLLPFSRPLAVPLSACYFLVRLLFPRPLAVPSSAYYSLVLLLFPRPLAISYSLICFLFLSHLHALCFPPFNLLIF